MAENPHHRPETPKQFLEVLEGRGGTLKVIARRHGRRAATMAVLGSVAGVTAVEWPRPKHQPPQDAEAHFQRGETFAGGRSAEGITKAIAEFKQAVGIDKFYAEAWASLANTYCAAIHYSYMDSRDATVQGDAAAREAIRLDPRFAKAHAALAYLASVNLKTWRSAGSEFEKALRLNAEEPLCHAWYAQFLGRLGCFEDAIAHAKKAVSLARVDFYFNHQLAAEYFRARKFPDYLKQSQDLVYLKDGEVDAHLGLARAFEWTGQFAKGLEECDAAEKLSQDRKSSMLVLCFRGTIEAAIREFKSAQKLADVVEDYWRSNPIESNILISLYARLQDYRKVMDMLNRAYAAGDANVLVCPTNPYLNGMRGLPEYQAFLRRLGFDPAEVLKFG